MLLVARWMRSEEALVAARDTPDALAVARGARHGILRERVTGGLQAIQDCQRRDAPPSDWIRLSIFLVLAGLFSEEEEAYAFFAFFGPGFF
jgi:hypothetical protein